MTAEFDVRDRLARAFPASLVNHTNRALELIALNDVRLVHPEVNSIGRVLVGDELVDIPYRISLGPRAVGSDGSVVEALMVACLYTREHDGFIRQAELARILDHEEPFVQPFIVQLLSEYVVEIAEEILAHIDRLPLEGYGTFGAANPEFMDRVRARVLSYYAAYYGSRFAFAEYPPFLALSRLGLWRWGLPRRSGKPRG